MKKQNLSTKQIIHQIYNDPKYAGKHVVAIDGNIFVAKTGDEAAKIFAEQTKKHPGATPMGTYVSDAEALILYGSKFSF